MTRCWSSSLCCPGRWPSNSASKGSEFSCGHVRCPPRARLCSLCCSGSRSVWPAAPSVSCDAMKRLILAAALVAGVTSAADLLPVVGIRDSMKYEVDPSADALWDSVSSTATAAGLVDKQPRSQAEWQEVRRYAVTLAEAANLLVIRGRRVALDGPIEDADIAGILPPAEIEKKIALDRPIF